MDIQFPEGLRVDAIHNGFMIRTDQPVAVGGKGAAPSPFDLFLASIGTCAGFYALRFCQERGIGTEGLALSVAPERDASGKRVKKIHTEITMPAGFPEKYREALLRAVDQCLVKRHLDEPPEFEIVAVPKRDAVPSTASEGAAAVH
jgi:ribosomal protein S12 methylthiotransferase accessory factor